jgi:repressor LexA
MGDPLTSRQREVFELVRKLIVDRGYGPTVREIAEHFQIRSPNGVMCHLRALEKKGLISRSPNKSRAIELTDPADRSSNNLPMAGRVAAGPTTLSFEQTERINFAEMFYKSDRFVLEVSGDSMIDAHIADGDYVVIEKRDEASTGEMVIAETSEGEVTLKYWYPEPGRVRLEPANQHMGPIFVKDAKVRGVVVGVVRNLRPPRPSRPLSPKSAVQSRM